MFINLSHFMGAGRSSGNGWKAWLKYLLQHETELHLEKAALVYEKGSIAASTNGFHLKSHDIKALKECFADPSSETISFQEKTYVIKSVNGGQLIAFHGHHYLIVNRTYKMFVITLCSSRQTCGLAAGWVQKIAGKLTEKNF